MTAACAVPTGPLPTNTPSETIVREVILDYISMPYEQIIDNSDAVFLGQVLAVSPTSWNQDSGQYWDGGLPVYTIAVEVLQVIVDSSTLADQVTITQVGYSPLEYGGAVPPVAGQRAVFFLIETQIAWENGRQAVLRTTNTAGDSIFVVGDDRLPALPTEEAAKLNEIIDDIAERRDLAPQPEVAATGTPGL